MKVVTFNVNGIRARLHQLSAVIERLSPDIIALQETKVMDDLFPLDELKSWGYDVIFHGQKSHYGVATLSRIPMELLHKNFPEEEEDCQRRTLISRHQKDGTTWTVLNGYFPQGENRNHPSKFQNKETYYRHLNQFTCEHKDSSPLILMGDFNVALANEDVGIEGAEQWIDRGYCSFLPEERAWYQQLMDQGLSDTWRHLNPDNNSTFSWFNYRDRAFSRTIKKGLRIDHILIDNAALDRLKDAGIDYQIRSMEKPSDHAPVWAFFS